MGHSHRDTEAEEAVQGSHLIWSVKFGIVTVRLGSGCGLAAACGWSFVEEVGEGLEGKVQTLLQSLLRLRVDSKRQPSHHTLGGCPWAENFTTFAQLCVQGKNQHKNTTLIMPKVEHTDTQTQAADLLRTDTLDGHEHAADLGRLLQTQSGKLPHQATQVHPGSPNQAQVNRKAE